MTRATAASGSAVVLVVIGDPELLANADRVLAAVGVRMLRADSPSRRSWLAAAAIIVDEDGARRCVRAGLPRRDAILVVSPGEPTADLWAVAVAVGGAQVCPLPAHEDDLVRHLAEAVQSGSSADRSGGLIGVTAGRGGAGASVFAAAVALCAGDALLVDLDPCGGGIDLLLGVEGTPGLRWPDLRLQGGRLVWSAIRDVLPSRHGVSLLSASRSYHDIESVALAAVVEAARRGGVTVVCDIPRHLTPSAICALQYSDLVVVLTSCDIRGAAAAAATASILTTVNPSIGLVVRGPSPGGLLAREVAAVASVPLLSSMRPEPGLAQRLERGGLRLRRRSPLAVAARSVLDVAQRSPSRRAA